MYDAPRGFNFRNYTDSNQDGYLTDLYMANCISSFGNAITYSSVTSFQVFSFRPDVNKGANPFYMWA